MPEGLVLYTTGTFAREIGKSVETVREWDRRGILTPMRDASGRRIYTADDIRRVKALEAERTRSRR